MITDARASVPDASRFGRGEAAALATFRRERFRAVASRRRSLVGGALVAAAALALFCVLTLAIGTGHRPVAPIPDGESEPIPTQPSGPSPSGPSAGRSVRTGTRRGRTPDLYRYSAAAAPARRPVRRRHRHHRLTRRRSRRTRKTPRTARKTPPPPRRRPPPASRPPGSTARHRASRPTPRRPATRSPDITGRAPASIPGIDAGDAHPPAPRRDVTQPGRVTRNQLL